jgi:uncharacterized protein YdbL (DUF1318 family)
MRPRNPYVFAAAVTFALAACLTVNVYFYPSEEVDQTAKQIIEDIRGTVMPENDLEETPTGEGAGSQGWRMTGVAHAADRETTVSSPAIDSIKERIRQRFNNLKPFFNAGAIGESNDGRVVIRDASVLPMKDRAKLNRIVSEENADREALYKEVAKELGVEDKDLPKVQRSFAQKWQAFAKAGWWVQDKAGNWGKR